MRVRKRKLYRYILLCIVGQYNYMVIRIEFTIVVYIFHTLERARLLALRPLPVFFKWKIKNAHTHTLTHIRPHFSRSPNRWAAFPNMHTQARVSHRCDSGVRSVRQMNGTPNKNQIHLYILHTQIYIRATHPYRTGLFSNPYGFKGEKATWLTAHINLHIGKSVGALFKIDYLNFDTYK